MLSNLYANRNKINKNSTNSYEMLALLDCKEKNLLSFHSGSLIMQIGKKDPGLSISGNKAR